MRSFFKVRVSQILVCESVSKCMAQDYPVTTAYQLNINAGFFLIPDYCECEQKRNSSDVIRDLNIIGGPTGICAT